MTFFFTKNFLLTKLLPMYSSFGLHFQINVQNCRSRVKKQKLSTIIMNVFRAKMWHIWRLASWGMPFWPPSYIIRNFGGKDMVVTLYKCKKREQKNGLTTTRRGEDCRWMDGLGWNCSHCSHMYTHTHMELKEDDFIINLNFFPREMIRAFTYYCNCYMYIYAIQPHDARSSKNSNLFSPSISGFQNRCSFWTFH